MGILRRTGVVQVIEVPKISQDPISATHAHRAAAGGTAGELASARTWSTLARGQDAAGSVWYQLASRAQGIYWWKLGTRHNPVELPGGTHRQLRAGIQILGKGDVVDAL